MVVSLYFGGKSHVSTGENVSFKEPCLTCGLNLETENKTKNQTEDGWKPASHLEPANFRPREFVNPFWLIPLAAVSLLTLRVPYRFPAFPLLSRGIVL